MKKAIYKKIIYQILMLMIVVFLYLPIYQMIITSLRPAELPWESPAPLFPEKITFSNFLKAFQLVPRMPRYLLNSFIYGIGVSTISLLVAIPAGYALARFKFLLRKGLMVIVIYANMFAPIMLLVPIYVIMRKFGLINTYFSVILSGSIFTIPLSTWLVTSYMQGIPKDIEEAALIDGCTTYSTIYRIVIPMISPALVAVFIYAFITGWSQQFILALGLIKNDQLMPIVQGLYQFFSRSSVRWNELMAAILISTIIPVIMFLLVQKYIVKGLTAGGLKE
ncbi:MAG: multiple sugar transport system permease protein [Thermosipho sp. (in: thermotogales)]|nr:multiple sugar transport system permease protein [Thermosipho sp. (in: thermotogales)]MDN5325097.1 multiple sugar transport system permease protein [Thermosipho sp. (in: thermotogales)]